MGIVVGIVIVVVLGLIVAKGFAVSDEGLAASQIQHLEEDSAESGAARHRHGEVAGSDEGA